MPISSRPRYNAPVGLDGQNDVVIVCGQDFGCLHLGQRHVKPFCHHGGRDHKDDQQHQHDVHKRRDVDLGNKIVVSGWAACLALPGKADAAAVIRRFMLQAFGGQAGVVDAYPFYIDELCLEHVVAAHGGYDTNNRPTAVAMSASAMPGATVASDTLFICAMAVRNA